MPDYDVIVVGAGAAGAPLAARLSDDPGRSVLLLEAGPDFARTGAFPPDLLDAGLLAGAVPGHPQNWGFTANLTRGRTKTLARGRVLGGSTTLNGTYYVRGRRADFDRWAGLGLTEWSYEKVLPFFRAQENDLDYGETAVHGGSGPLPVRRALTGLHPVTEAFGEACAELGFAAEPDKNAEGQPGCGPLPVNAVGGLRVNTGIAFVNPCRGRPNLTVQGDAFVRRVLFRGTRACAVEVDRHGRTEAVGGTQIVLACGAIKSPHLLALSGVGPGRELSAAGIDVIADLPGVGKNFSDHPDFSLRWVPAGQHGQLRPGSPFESLLNFSSAGTDSAGTDSAGTDFAGTDFAGTDPAGTDSVGTVQCGDLQIMPVLKPVGMAAAAGGPAVLALSVALLRCAARGAITTVSSDPRVPPRIDHHYLEHQSDVAGLRQAARVAVEILRTRPFRGQVGRLADLDEATVRDDGRLDAWVRAHLSTAIHTAGSCAMGSDPGSGAVVDQFGRVYGVTGLRVADTSIMPRVPCRGPAATAIMIGTRMAELVDRDTRAAGRGAGPT
jgi:choline dehydrogenase-like flavoprotein